MTHRSMGRKIQTYALQVGAGLLLMGSLATIAPVTTSAQSVDVRVYDEHHKDYHNWDDHEDRAYRRYLAEKHYDYVEFQKQSARRQRAYWDWRHSHPD